MLRTPLDIERIRDQKRTLDQQAVRPKFLSASERQQQKEAAKRALEVEKRYQPLVKTSGQIKSAAKPNGSEAENLAYRNRYLGLEDLKRKKRKVNDPKKFNFDWDAGDDTSVDAIPIIAPDSQSRDQRRSGRSNLNEKNAMRTQTASRTPEREYSNARQAQKYKQSWDERHWSEKALDDMRERDWRIFKEDFNIQVKGGHLAYPLRNWDEANFPEQIFDAIKRFGYTEPTPIQRATIPIGLQCRDIIGIAETGSGKTASFVLPMLVYISSLPQLDATNKNDGPYAVVLAPTRELVLQIEAETRKFAACMGLRVVSVVGGHKIEEQSFNLRDGAEVIIATPGRLLDCLEQHVLVLSQCNYVVMDEADRMVDLGFEEAVNQILDALPAQGMKPDSAAAEEPERMSAFLSRNLKYRQTVMFSATMPPTVEKLARKYLRRPATVLIGNAGQVVETVEQRVEIINGEEKRKRRLEEVLNSQEFDSPVIVFVNKKRDCDTISRHLASIGWNAVILHGGKTQDQREASLAKLRSGEADVLVATDLAGRGIDVPNVSLVLNFNMSKTVEDYVHRIGRTGRAGKKGVALTFVGDEDEALFFQMKGVLKKASNVPAAIRSAMKVTERDVVD